MKNMTIIGIGLGLLLTLITVLGGFWAFIGALVLGFIGGVIGAHLDGRIDLRGLADSLSPGRGDRG